jgi:hypothetical protein
MSVNTVAKKLMPKAAHDDGTAGDDAHVRGSGAQTGLREAPPIIDLTLEPGSPPTR